MNKKFFKQNRVTLTGLFIVSLILLGFAVFYFMFFKIRSQATVYLSVVLVKSLNVSNVPAYWVPYWVADSINTGDREISPLGQFSAEVIDKTAYKDRLYGNYVHLVLRTRVTRNRAGIYLYKNKPLKAGSFIELNLPKADSNAMVMSVGESVPVYKYKKIVFRSVFREIEPWMADMLKVGSLIKNSKGQTVARLADKEVRLAEVPAETSSGSIAVSQNRLKRDMFTTVELLAQTVNGDYYFRDVDRIRVNENIYISWSEGELYHHINEIIKIEDTEKDSI